MGAQNTFKDLQNFISDYLSEFLHEAGITLCVCVQKKPKQNKTRTQTETTEQVIYLCSQIVAE